MDKSPTRKLIAEIPEPLFKLLKVKAVHEDRLMRDLVAEALRMYLGTKGGITPSETQTRVLLKASGVSKPPKK